LRHRQAGCPPRRLSGAIVKNLQMPLLADITDTLTNTVGKVASVVDKTEWTPQVKDSLDWLKANEINLIVGDGNSSVQSAHVVRSCAGCGDHRVGESSIHVAIKPLGQPQGRWAGPKRTQHVYHQAIPHRQPRNPVSATATFESSAILQKLLPKNALGLSTKGGQSRARQTIAVRQRWRIPASRGKTERGQKRLQLFAHNF
jgi:hypothetical protein